MFGVPHRAILEFGTTAFAASLFALMVGILAFVALNRHRELAIGLGLASAGLGSFLTAQRTIHNEDDILNYHKLYLALGRGDWTLVEQLGGGLEVGLPILLRLLHFVFGELSVRELMFWLTFTGTSAAVAVYAWLIPRVAGQRHFGLKLAFSLAFISFFTASHTTRQFLAGVVLLPLLVSRSAFWNVFLLTAISTLTHLTSVIYVFLITLCRSRLAFRLTFPLLLVFGMWAILKIEVVFDLAFDFMPAIVQGKLSGLMLQDNANTEVSNFPDLIRLGMLCALVAVSNSLWPDSVPPWTRRFIYVGFVTFALLIEAPFAGNRLNHMILNVAFGLVVMMSLQRSIFAMRVVVLIGLTYQIRLLLIY